MSDKENSLYKKFGALESSMNKLNSQMNYFMQGQYIGEIIMDNARLYKQISLEIINAIENNNIDILNELFEKRQNILNNSENINKLKDDLIKSEILEIDNKIKTLLSKEIEKTKSEIKEHRRSIMVNNSYIQNNKEILNLFNKKV